MVGKSHDRWWCGGERLQGVVRRSERGLWGGEAGRERNSEESEKRSEGEKRDGEKTSKWGKERKNESKEKKKSGEGLVCNTLIEVLGVLLFSLFFFFSFYIHLQKLHLSPYNLK